MRCIRTLIMSCAVMLVSNVVVESADSTTKNSPPETPAETTSVPLTERIVIQAFCDVDSKLVSDVAEHLALVFPVAVDRLPCLKAPDQTLKAHAKAAFDGLGQNAYGVALYDMGTNENERTILIVEDRLALVNIQTLIRSTSNVSRSDAAFAWRVKKEAIRGIGDLLGFDWCATYTCALDRHRNIEGLDKKGRGFCPPHMKKVRLFFFEKGYTLKQRK